jgi:hypothetical protein
VPSQLSLVTSNEAKPTVLGTSVSSWDPRSSVQVSHLRVTPGKNASGEPLSPSSLVLAAGTTRACVYWDVVGMRNGVTTGAVWSVGSDVFLDNRDGVVWNRGTSAHNVNWCYPGDENGSSTGSLSTETIVVAAAPLPIGHYRFQYYVSGYPAIDVTFAVG